ncbi:hypothetical protein [Caulobacter sp.]|uniref:hypothetical protein n=1 Tax=Caulobacter sp. TaxID=78 RepID=UPI003BAFF523
MHAEDFDVVERLRLAGITLSASLEAPGGGETVILDTEQALAYLAEPTVFSAAYFGLSGEDYEAWLDLEGQAMCGEITASGSRCRNPLSGPIQLTADEWKQRHGGRCSVHGGEIAARRNKRPVMP